MMGRTHDTRLKKLEIASRGSKGRVIVIHVREGFVEEDKAACLATLAAAGEPALDDDTVVFITIFEGRDGEPLPPSMAGVVQTGAPQRGKPV